jgi:hypothetical protein
MAKQPENLTIRVLRELRDEVRDGNARSEKRFDALEADIKRIDKRLDAIRLAQAGESFMAAVTVGEIDERFADHDKRLAALEGKSPSPKPRRR